MPSPRAPVQNGGPCPQCGAPTAPFGPSGKRRCSDDSCELSQGYLPSEISKADSGYSERDRRIALKVTELMRGTATLANGQRQPFPYDYATACRAAPELVDDEMAAELTPEGNDESGGRGAVPSPPPPVRGKTRTQTRQFATLKRGERPDPEWAREQHIAKAMETCRAASAADPAEAVVAIRKRAQAGIISVMEALAKRSYPGDADPLVRLLADKNNVGPELYVLHEMLRGG